MVCFEKSTTRLSFNVEIQSENDPVANIVPAAMSGPKHLTVAPRTVLDLDHVLVTIVQCCPSSGDVMAFLAALPASAHTTPLAALHELLRNPVEAIQFMVDWRRSSPAVNPLEHETAVRMLWSVLQQHELTAAAAALAVHAMPAFTVVAARAVDPKQRVLGPEDFHWLGQLVRGLDIPAFSILEGGYSEDLPQLVLAYLQGLEGR